MADKLPSLSVIIAARNEAGPRRRGRAIAAKPGLYPDLEILIVNDRFGRTSRGISINALRAIVGGLNQVPGTFSRNRIAVRSDRGFDLVVRCLEVEKSTRSNPPRASSAALDARRIRTDSQRGMWKSRPVIATPVGGIKTQIDHGYNGYLVESTEDCAEYMVQLLTDRMMAEKIGAAAKRSVRERFLISRLVQDHLQLYAEAAGTEASTKTAA